MEKASHRLSLHANASVLLAKVQVERLFFIDVDAARDLAGKEDVLQKKLHYSSGAYVDIQTKMHTKSPGMLVKGNGTEAELFILGREVKLLNKRAEAEKQSKRKVRVRYVPILAPLSLLCLLSGALQT